MTTSLTGVYGFVGHHISGTQRGTFCKSGFWSAIDR